MMKGLTWPHTSRYCYLYLFSLFEPDRTRLLRHLFAGSDSCGYLRGQCVLKIMFAIFYVVSRIAKFHTTSLYHCTELEACKAGSIERMAMN